MFKGKLYAEDLPVFIIRKFAVLLIPNIYFFFYQGTRNMSSSSDTTDADPDDENVIKEASIPNEGWTEKTLKFYNELSELCESGEWEKIKSFYHYGNEGRLFVRALEMPGKQFEYASFLNREEKCIRTVVQFGPWLQGPKG